MGLRFRKSINLGHGFRINLSKSGIGYSLGAPGFRFTKTASGRKRTTYSIPGTGISYVSESGKKKSATKNHSQNFSTPQLYQNYDNANNFTEISNASINNFQSVEYLDLLHRISRILKADKVANILSFFIIFSFTSTPLFFVVGIIGFLLKICIRIGMHIKLDYEMDAYYNEKYTERINTWETLNTTQSLWQILGAGNVTNKKVEAGASRTVKRKPFKLSSKVPFFLKTNLKIITLNLQKEKMIILPDKILIIRGTKVGAEDYDNISISISSTEFIEHQIVPRDTEVLYHTWQYVNKDGGPDKRFKNNRQLPVCKYGVIRLKSESGINIELQFSNYRIANQLKNTLTI